MFRLPHRGSNNPSPTRSSRTDSRKGGDPRTASGAGMSHTSTGSNGSTSGMSTFSTSFIASANLPPRPQSPNGPSTPSVTTPNSFDRPRPSSSSGGRSRGSESPTKRITANVTPRASGNPFQSLPGSNSGRRTPTTGRNSPGSSPGSGSTTRRRTRSRRSSPLKRSATSTAGQSRDVRRRTDAVPMGSSRDHPIVLSSDIEPSDDEPGRLNANGVGAFVSGLFEQNGSKRTTEPNGEMDMDLDNDSTHDGSDSDSDLESYEEWASAVSSVRTSLSPSISPVRPGTRSRSRTSSKTKSPTPAPVNLFAERDERDQWISRRLERRGIVPPAHTPRANGSGRRVDQSSDTEHGLTTASENEHESDSRVGTRRDRTRGPAPVPMGTGHSLLSRMGGIIVEDRPSLSFVLAPRPIEPERALERVEAEKEDDGPVVHVDSDFLDALVLGSQAGSVMGDEDNIDSDATRETNGPIPHHDAGRTQGDDIGDHMSPGVRATSPMDQPQEPTRTPDDWEMVSPPKSLDESYRPATPPLDDLYMDLSVPSGDLAVSADPVPPTADCSTKDTGVNLSVGEKRPSPDNTNGHDTDDNGKRDHVDRPGKRRTLNDRLGSVDIPHPESEKSMGKGSPEPQNTSSSSTPPIASDTSRTSHSVQLSPLETHHEATLSIARPLIELLIAELAGDDSGTNGSTRRVKCLEGWQLAFADGLMPFKNDLKRLLETMGAQILDLDSYRMRMPFKHDRTSSGSPLNGARSPLDGNARRETGESRPSWLREIDPFLPHRLVVFPSTSRIVDMETYGPHVDTQHLVIVGLLSIVIQARTTERRRSLPATMPLQSSRNITEQADEGSTSSTTEPPRPRLVDRLQGSGNLRSASRTPPAEPSRLSRALGPPSAAQALAPVPVLHRQPPTAPSSMRNGLVSLSSWTPRTDPSTAARGSVNVSMSNDGQIRRSVTQSNALPTTTHANGTTARFGDRPLSQRIKSMRDRPLVSPMPQTPELSWELETPRLSQRIEGGEQGNDWGQPQWTRGIPDEPESESDGSDSDESE